MIEDYAVRFEYPSIWDNLVAGVARASAYRTPAVASVLYHSGGQLVRNYDNIEILEGALKKLELAMEIWLENQREREAAYAANFAAEAYWKLGRLENAREKLRFAKQRLSGAKDQSMIACVRRLEERLAKGKLGSE